MCILHGEVIMEPAITLEFVTMNLSHKVVAIKFRAKLFKKFGGYFTSITLNDWTIMYLPLKFKIEE